MHPSHTNWFNTCLERVVPANGGDVGAIALARQIDDQNAALWRPVVLLLTKKGEPIAGSDWLPIATRGNAGDLVVTGEREALVVVTQRRSDCPQPIVDMPYWFSVTWRGRKLKVEEIGRWDDVNLGMCLKGTAMNGGAVWAGSYYPPPVTKPSGYKETRLVLGYSQGHEIPAYRLTEAECVYVSNPVPFGDEVYVLVTARFERIELWAFDRLFNVRKVLEVERSKKTGKQTLGPGRLARCGDGLMMFWCHYTDKVGVKRPRTWQGLIHAASFHPATHAVSEVVPATTDTRVIGATLDVHPLDASLVVTWESRPKRGGGGMRALRCSSLDDLPRDAVVLPEKNAPLFNPQASGSILRSGQTPETSSWAIPMELSSLENAPESP